MNEFILDRETALIIYAALKSGAAALQALRSAMLSVAALFERKYNLGQAKALPKVESETYTVTAESKSNNLEL